MTLKYLLLDDFSEQCTSETQLRGRVEKYKFYQYCAANWLTHTRKVKHEDSSLFELVDCFVFNSPSNLRSYRQMMMRMCHDLDKKCPSLRNRCHGCKNSGPDRAFCKVEFDQGYQLSDIRTALFGGLIEGDLGWMIKRIVVKRPELLDADIGPAGPPLRIAALKGYSSIVADLLHLGADIHRKCSAYDLPEIIYFYHTAAAGEWYGPTDSTYHFYEPLSGLLRRKPPLSRKLSRPIEDAPFEFPVHTISQSTPEALPLLLRIAPDEVHKRCGNGSAPIHYAVLSNSLKAVQTLVAAGADIDAETNAGRTPLHIAVSLQNGSIVEYLLDCGVAIPSDITASEFDFADAHLGGDLLSGWLEIGGALRQEKEARSRLSKKVKAHPTPEAVGPHFFDHEGWIRATVLREDNKLFKGGTQQNPYVSITITGKSVKRIVFRIKSSDTGMISTITQTCQPTNRRTQQ